MQEKGILVKLCKAINLLDIEDFTTRCLVKLRFEIKSNCHNYNCQ